MRKTPDRKVHKKGKSQTLLFKSWNKFELLPKKRAAKNKSLKKMIKISKTDMRMIHRIWILMRIQTHMTKMKTWIRGD